MQFMIRFMHGSSEHRFLSELKVTRCIDFAKDDLRLCAGDLHNSNDFLSNVSCGLKVAHSTNCRSNMPRKSRPRIPDLVILATVTVCCTVMLGNWNCESNSPNAFSLLPNCSQWPTFSKSCPVQYLPFIFIYDSEHCKSFTGLSSKHNWT